MYELHNNQKVEPTFNFSENIVEDYKPAQNLPLLYVGLFIAFIVLLIIGYYIYCKFYKKENMKFKFTDHRPRKVIRGHHY